ncbi:kinesin light chain [Colletotrichum tofieldiae]|nr:kinesin light chain [Colletotrichum tofieldiae]GKT77041.1 kinesin light chain [Colletotrichum tofieldiae]
MGISEIEEGKADIKSLVKTALTGEDVGCWLLIIDNADDADLLFADLNGPSLFSYLPFSRQGSILVTTRNRGVSDRFDIRGADAFAVGEMSMPEARELLQGNLTDSQFCNAESTEALLHLLACLPLAIKQTSACTVVNEMGTTKYLAYCRFSDKTQIELLSRDFEDRSLYQDIADPTATTWLVSFTQLLRSRPLAARYLKFICYLAEKDIPLELLPLEEDKMATDEALGTLKAYAFIQQREATDRFDIHQLPYNAWEIQ